MESMAIVPVRRQLLRFVFALRAPRVIGRHSHALAANSTGSTVDASSFSGLFTRVEIGHIRISSAGHGRIRSRGSGTSLSQRA